MPAPDTLWETAAQLYRRDDEQVKLAVYRLALHVLPRRPVSAPASPGPC